MISLMAEGAKISSECRRQLRIHKETHAYAVLMMGWSLCLAAYSSAAVMSSSSRYG